MCFLTCALVSHAQAPNPARNALVVGNGKYKDSPLTNAPNDAKAMAQALRGLGFQVTLIVDGSMKQLAEAVRLFGDQLNKGGVGLFYYAGHGMQIKGRNFLIPVDADIKREDEVAYTSLDVSSVLDKMESARNGTNIMVLDACRNNPFARSFRSSASGLAQMDAPVGTYISFATAPGKVASDGEGDNGLYTEQLLKVLREPGLKIEDVFKRVRVKVMTESQGQQVPWDNSSLTGDFYFLGGAAEPAAVAVAKPVETEQLAALSPNTNKPVAEKPAAAPRLIVPSTPPTIAPVKNDSEERYRLATEALKRGEVAAALAGFEEAAKKGHALAAFEAGQLYKTGRKPVNQDLTLARSFYAKAAPSHPPAALQLGLLYERGQGGEKSCKDAQQWFAKSAERGVVDAMAALGDLLLRPCDGQKNLSEAARWLKLAADKASTPAMFSLGVLYFTGEGVGKDSAEARKWLSLAAERGHPSAKTYLDRLR